jgi:hypothetical protein
MTDFQKCCVIIKTGARRGECCGKHTEIMNPMSRLYFCKTHLKNIGEMDTLCTYGSTGILLSDDCNQAVQALPPDIKGEDNIKLLKGYINIRIMEPFVEHEVPLVFMSKLEGYGEHFDRASLAECIKSTIEYFISRPDAYVLQPGATLDNIRLMSISFNMHYYQFIANIRVDPRQ